MPHRDSALVSCLLCSRNTTGLDWPEWKQVGKCITRRCGILYEGYVFLQEQSNFHSDSVTDLNQVPRLKKQMHVYFSSRYLWLVTTTSAALEMLALTPLVHISFAWFSSLFKDDTSTGSHVNPK